MEKMIMSAMNYRFHGKIGGIIMSEKYFTKPNRPFLLIYTDTDDSISYAWLETEEELREVIEEVTSYGCEIQDAIEISSSRDINIDLI